VVVAHLPWAHALPFQRLQPVSSSLNVFNNLGNLLSLRLHPQCCQQVGFCDSLATDQAGMCSTLLLTIPASSASRFVPRHIRSENLGDRQFLRAISQRHGAYD
jgi:hypothetical protein